MNLLFYISCLSAVVFSMATDKCCEVCNNCTDKYYSIPPFFKNNCGESCISPDDYIKYKIFEPALTKANTSQPCYEKGFVYYVDTETHGFGPIKIVVDLYTKKED